MSARVGLFAIRHQRGGVITALLFSAPPSEARLAAEKVRLDKRYGSGWVRVVPVALELADEHADLAARFSSPPEEPPPPEPGTAGALPGIVIHAVGTYTPPR
jgi:hypothetical protein